MQNYRSISNSYFKCPYSKMPFTNPVFLPCGHTLDRDSAEAISDNTSIPCHYYDEENGILCMDFQCKLSKKGHFFPRDYNAHLKQQHGKTYKFPMSCGHYIHVLDAKQLVDSCKSICPVCSGEFSKKDLVANTLVIQMMNINTSADCDIQIISAPTQPTKKTVQVIDLDEIETPQLPIKKKRKMVIID